MTTLLNSDAPWPIPLTVDEIVKLKEAMEDICSMAVIHSNKRPKMTTLIEEVAEAILASRGKHDDPLELELQQIASICINLVWQIRCGHDVANLQTRRDKQT